MNRQITMVFFACVADGKTPLEDDNVMGALFPATLGPREPERGESIHTRRFHIQSHGVVIANGIICQSPTRLCRETLDDPAHAVLYFTKYPQKQPRRGYSYWKKPQHRLGILAAVPT